MILRGSVVIITDFIIEAIRLVTKHEEERNLTEEILIYIYMNWANTKPVALHGSIDRSEPGVDFI